MKKLLRFLFLLFLASCLVKSVCAQETLHMLSPKGPDPTLRLELLSDTGGVDTDLYVKNLSSNLKKNWLPLVSSAVELPVLKPEETRISITIAPDGRLLATRLEASTRDIAVDRAAWMAIKSTPYLPPPAGMKEPNLKLRVHFVIEDN